MTDAMRVLYTYAQEHMVYALLAQEPGYADAKMCADKREEQFRALLDDTAQEHLEALLDEQGHLDFYWGQALFCAGFSLAVELSRI